MANYIDAAIDNRAESMEQLIRRYFAACNVADVEGIAACFTKDAIHYFPPGMYEGPFQGAAIIAEKWREAVRALGSYWTIDRLLVEPIAYEAVMEWTHFKTKQKAVLRGIEWYEFDQETGLIREIRAYYASPQARDLDRLELGGFDYLGRGYPMSPPPGAR